MPEPPTHYQLSFTTRQATALFVGLLLALGAAYLLGVLTGLAGRDGGNTAARVTPAATPEAIRSESIAAAVPSPTAIRPLPTRAASIPAFPRPVLGREPTARRIEFFEDRAESEPTASATRSPSQAAPKRSPTRPPKVEAGGFWIQVASVSSQREAAARRDRLIHHGYHARVLAGEGSKGKIYRVRVGPYASREEASRASDRLSREEKVKTWIAPPGK